MMVLELRERAGGEMESRQGRGIGIGALVGAVLGGVIFRLVFGPGSGIYLYTHWSRQWGSFGRLLNRP